MNDAQVDEVIDYIRCRCPDSKITTAILKLKQEWSAMKAGYEGKKYLPFVGDEVWSIVRFNDRYPWCVSIEFGIVGEVDFNSDLRALTVRGDSIPVYNVFPTQEEAQEEADRRNNADS